jgi:hypothetical protein
MQRLSDITTTRLTDLAGRLFFNTMPTLSAIGPVQDLAPFDDIIQSLGGHAAQHKTAAE